MESPPALSRNGPVFSQIGSELRMWKEIWKEWVSGVEIFNEMLSRQP
jgi:hypothetical protein